MGGHGDSFDDLDGANLIFTSNNDILGLEIKKNSALHTDHFAFNILLNFLF